MEPGDNWDGDGVALAVIDCSVGGEVGDGCWGVEDRGKEGRDVSSCDFNDSSTGREKNHTPSTSKATENRRMRRGFIRKKVASRDCYPKRLADEISHRLDAFTSRF